MPWITKYGINCKTMVYQQSCFPNCLHMALNNMGKAPQDDSVETLWNTLQIAAQKPGLAAAAPDENDILRNLPETPAVTQFKLLTPSMLGPNTSEADVMSMVGAFFTGGFRAMVTGVGHAVLYYRLSATSYIYVHASPDLAQLDVEQSLGSVSLKILNDGAGNKAVQLTSSSNPNFGGIAGNFVLLI